MRVRGKKKKKDEQRQGETQEIMKAKLVWSLAKEKTGHSEGSCSRFANGKKRVQLHHNNVQNGRQNRKRKTIKDDN